MGTPKNGSVAKNVQKREVTVPTLAEKLRLLEIGRDIGKTLNSKMLAHVLEGMKDILLPLVPWLDKPLFSEWQHPPRTFPMMRALPLLESHFMDICLERSGIWFVRLRQPEQKDTYQEADSLCLAKIMVKKSASFLNPRDKKLIEKFPFLTDIVLYNAIILNIPSRFFKSVSALLEERERRISVMKKRLDLLADFTQALEPLISQGKKIQIREYSIFEETGNGISRSTGCYFTPAALEPFWKIIKERNDSGYVPKADEYYIESLEGLQQRITWISEEISSAESYGHTTANALFGFNSGRLPLTEEELTILKDAIKSVTE